MIPDRDLEIDSFTLTANLNFHVLRGETLNLYVGPTLGYGFWDDLEVEGLPDPFPTKDRFIYGLNLGVDVMFGAKKQWGLNAALNYLVADFEVEDAPTSTDFGVSPAQIKVGAVFRF
jgi:hypothetical protein